MFSDISDIKPMSTDTIEDPPFVFNLSDLLDDSGMKLSEFVKWTQETGSIVVKKFRIPSKANTVILCGLARDDGGYMEYRVFVDDRLIRGLLQFKPSAELAYCSVCEGVFWKKHFQHSECTPGAPSAVKISMSTDTPDPPSEPYLIDILYYGSGLDLNTPFLLQHKMKFGTFKVHYIDPLEGENYEGVIISLRSPYMEFYHMKAEEFQRPEKPCIIFISRNSSSSVADCGKISGYLPPPECYRPGDTVWLGCNTCPGGPLPPDSVTVKSICVNVGQGLCDCDCMHLRPLDLTPAAPAVPAGQLPSPGFTRMTKRIRAPRHGQRKIQCPACGHIDAVRHFQWTALGCTACKNMIKKKDWFVSPRP